MSLCYTLWLGNDVESVAALRVVYEPLLCRDDCGLDGVIRYAQRRVCWARAREAIKRVTGWDGMMMAMQTSL